MMIEESVEYRLVPVWLIAAATIAERRRRVTKRLRKQCACFAAPLLRERADTILAFSGWNAVDDELDAA